MGSLVISLDAELRWGFHDLPDSNLDRADRARESWLRLVELLDEFAVPATWSVVGHLFLDECDGQHDDHPTPTGWFDPDPGTDLHQNPGWYGPDLINAILEARVRHEVGCHGFSHVEIGRSDVPRELVEAELAASREAAAAAMDVDLRSFVFPRNIVGNRSSLADAGFESYRTRHPRRLDSTPIRLPRKGLATCLGRPAPLVTPRIDEFGLVAIPPSIDLFGFEGPARRLVRPLRKTPILDRVERGIDAVFDDDGIVHLWFHPSDLSRPGGTDRVRSVLETIDAAREDGLTVETMGAVARRIRNVRHPALDQPVQSI